MKIELFQKIYDAGHWRTLQAICACSQICNWFWFINQQDSFTNYTYIINVDWRQRSNILAL